MNTRYVSTLPFLMALLLPCTTLSSAQELKPIQLPMPQMDGGKSLMQVLKDRKTSRAFSGEELPIHVLSDMLWAAFGVNRPETGKRTAPSAVNWQEIGICVATADGLYLYKAPSHELGPVLRENLRPLTGRQSFVKEAPVNLVFVADYSRMGQATEADKDFNSAEDTGFISQNAYLYCASEGLATVVGGVIDRPALKEAKGLRSDQRVILAQTVGYPEE